LPLPPPSEPTFWERHFADFKEGILQRVQIIDEEARKAYADYLCRSYPTHDGAPVRSIVWELEWQDLPPPGASAAPDATVHTQVLGVYPAAPVREKGP